MTPVHAKVRPGSLFQVQMHIVRCSTLEVIPLPLSGGAKVVLPHQPSVTPAWVYSQLGRELLTQATCLSQPFCSCGNTSEDYFFISVNRK